MHEVREVMGGLFTVEARGADAAELTSAVDAAFGEMEELDRLLTTYDPGSQVMRINRSAGKEDVPVDPRVMDVLKVCRDWWKRSDGAIDCTVGPLVQLWGIQSGDGPGAYPPPRERVDLALQLVGMDKVVLNDISGTVRLDRYGMALDLGAIGKGYAVDQAVRILRKRDVPSAMVDASGDLRVYGPGPDGKAWKVPIPHPRDPQRVLTVLEVSDGAVAVSSDTTKRVYVPSTAKYYADVLDPKTGLPVEGVALAVVIAPDATTADALSTILFVQGRPRGMRLVEAVPGAEALLVDYDPHKANVLRAAATPGLRGKLHLDL